MNKTVRLVAIAATASLALAACGGNSSNSGGSSDSDALIVSTDMPLQGASKDASDSTNNMIELYLKSVNYKAGKYTVKLQKYDDSTATKGGWDDAQCAKNANDHVANAKEVAVMGTYNSGCAKIEVPVLNKDAGPMLMVSHANTNPGLTKEWDAGEPTKYYPSGKRNYARVITTDDYQGQAAASFASSLGVKKIYILNDNQTYGQGVGKAVETAAKASGIQVLGNEPWDAKQTSYASLFTKIKATNPDMIYLAGIYDLNGGQLIRDKVATLGDNTKVKLMAPDGFTGYPEMAKLPEAEGTYLSFGGLSTDQLLAAGGKAKTLLEEYKKTYNADPATSYALYGVAAIQVILAAIEKSDGTRAGVNNAVFSGSGITISAADSAIGKDFTIDPKTGDSSVRDISILQMKGGKETFLKVETVK